MKANSTKGPGAQLRRYVTLNICGMVGVSAYILADTFFISRVKGTDGITALNLVLPLYSLIFAIGQLIAVGSATRYALLRSRGQKEADICFSHALTWAAIASLPFILAGLLWPGELMRLLGGDEGIVAVGLPYTRIFLLFAPFFMWNYIANAFVRNDRDPGTAMTATLLSSLFNIVFDYLLMFPLGLGMAGAALATVFSPIVGMLICLFGHFLRKKNSVKPVWAPLSVRWLCRAAALGVSAFIGEMASGITTMIFNYLMLSLAGNDGVAAYGVIANTASVATAVFNGIAQGAQPLESDSYGRGREKEAALLGRMAAAAAFVLALLILLLSQLFPRQLTAVFNQEGNEVMARYAVRGIRIYFTGYLFAGLNIAGCGYLSATAQAGAAFAVSLSRGVAAIVACSLLLSSLFGLTGVWMAFPAAEALTFALMLWLRAKKHEKGQTFTP